VDPFKWTVAAMHNLTALPVEMINTTMVKTNQWGKRINSTAMAELVSVGLVNRMKISFANYYTCQFRPLMEALKTFTCDCISNDTNTTCFSKENLAQIDVMWSGLPKKIVTLHKFYLKTYINTINATVDFSSVTLEEVEYSNGSLNVLDADGNTIGEIVGGAIKIIVNPVADNDFQLGLPVDLSVNSIYPEWDVGVLDGDKIVALYAGKLIDSKVYVDVKDNAVYYAIRVKTKICSMASFITARDLLIHQFSLLESASKISDISVILGMNPFANKETAACFAQLEGIGTTEVKTYDFIDTQECFYDYYDPMFKTDPCCAVEAQESLCCTPHNITVVKNHTLPSGSALNTTFQCFHSDLVAATVKILVESETANTADCQFNIAGITEEDMLAPVLVVNKCYSYVLRGTSCETDADCSYGIPCTAVGLGTAACLPETDLIDEALVRCMAENLKPEDLRFLRKHFNLKGNSDFSEVILKFEEKATYNGCVGYDVSRLPSNMSDVDCVNYEKCNLANTNCTSTNFCGLCLFTGDCYGSADIDPQYCHGFVETQANPCFVRPRSYRQSNLFGERFESMILSCL
jgi:hypothetical protein